MRTSSFRRLIGAGVSCVALAAGSVAIAVPAGAADSGTGGATGARARVHLTDEQRQCLTDHGVTRPIRPLTKEKAQTIRDAAKACDIKLPNLRHRPHLTDEQRQCLTDHGVTRPIRPLTKEKAQTIKDAATACSITLPNHAGTAAPQT